MTVPRASLLGASVLSSSNALYNHVNSVEAVQTSDALYGNFHRDVNGNTVSVGAARSLGTFAPELYLRAGNVPLVPGTLGAQGTWDARLVGSSALTRYLETPDIPLTEKAQSVAHSDEAGTSDDAVSVMWYYATRVSGTGEAFVWSYDKCPNACSGRGSCGTGSDPHGCICQPGYNDEIDCSVGPPENDPDGFNPFQVRETNCLKYRVDILKV